MVQGFRRRRAIKKALREEAPKVARALWSVRGSVRVEGGRAKQELHRYLSDDPPCRNCGRPMTINTAKRGSYNGRQFWGCRGCRLEPIELSEFPKAAARHLGL
jgi:formamidopyrimidine-DNA glycosylase